MEMRVFDLCFSCMYLLELKKMEPPVEIPVIRCCRVVETKSCVRLGRTWPICQKGENVFDQSLTCREFSSGIPRQLSLVIVPSPSLKQ